MQKASTHVGLDVHQKEIAVAMLRGGEERAVEWVVANERGSVRRLARKLERVSEGDVVCAYEAGPCGYALQRQLKEEGLGCVVVAPSLIPRKPGERVKTDRRDARKLAELLRAGLLTEVHCPSSEEEAVRDLCRCREDILEDRQRARHRLGKMLLRRGLRYGLGKPWTQRHRRWLWSVRFEHEADRLTLENYLIAVEHLELRLQALDEQLAALAQRDPYREPVGWLRCFQGIDTLTAITLLVELHDFRRFRGPRQLMAYLGLVPSESSSGELQRRGGLTKAGNRHARRVLIESAWHYRHRPGVPVALRRRRQGQPPEIIALADRAHQRLHRRYHRLVVGKGKPTPKVIAALARELAGFLWAGLYLYPQSQTLTKAA